MSDEQQLPIEQSGLVPDKHNANQGTQRGRGLLEKSLRRLGGGRSILADKSGNVIAGNKTLEIAAQIGLPVRVIETDGNELIVVQRTDLDLYSEQDRRGRELAYADNKVAELDLSWSPEQIAVDLAAGVDLEGWGVVSKPVDFDEIMRGMPDYEQDDKKGIIITVHFLNDDDKLEFFKKVGIPFTEKTKSFWYPERPESLRDQLGTKAGLVYSES